MNIQLALLSAFIAVPVFAADPIQDNKSAPHFDVASVKHSDTGQRRSLVCPPLAGPGLFRCNGAALRPLLQWAYGLPSDQLKGPAWIDSERYDIEAKIPPGTRDEELKLMVRNLLIERFGIVTHTESVERAVYELVVAKGGLKMNRAAPAVETGAQPDNASPSGAPRPQLNKEGFPEFPPGTPAMFVTKVKGSQWLTARSKGIADLIGILHNQIGRPVIDKTGLTGLYDFNLRYTNLSANTGNAGLAGSPETASDEPGTFSMTLPEAFERQLGLKLEPKRAPVETLVIDGIRHDPADQ